MAKSFAQGSPESWKPVGWRLGLIRSISAMTGIGNSQFWFWVVSYVFRGFKWSACLPQLAGQLGPFRDRRVNFGASGERRQAVSRPECFPGGQEATFTRICYKSVPKVYCGPSKVYPGGLWAAKSVPWGAVGLWTRPQKCTLGGCGPLRKCTLGGCGPSASNDHLT